MTSYAWKMLLLVRENKLGIWSVKSQGILLSLMCGNLVTNTVDFSARYGTIANKKKKFDKERQRTPLASPLHIGAILIFFLAPA